MNGKFFFFNDTATTEIYTLSLHDALPIFPLIALTKRRDSTLARAAEHVLLMPDAPEACSIGMAPTTSTTMTMALGDALAVALMEARGFDRESYHAFHPGGTLGAQLLRVSAIMHRGAELPVVAPETPMSDTLVEMSQKGFGVAAVVAAGGTLHGIITDGDLRRNMAGLMDQTAGEVATPNPLTIAPDTLLTEALGEMNRLKRTALLVVDETGALIGLVHIHDLLRAGVA